MSCFGDSFSSSVCNRENNLKYIKTSVDIITTSCKLCEMFLEEKAILSSSVLLFLFSQMTKETAF